MALPTNVNPHNLVPTDKFDPNDRRPFHFVDTASRYKDVYWEPGLDLDAEKKKWDERTSPTGAPDSGASSVFPSADPSGNLTPATVADPPMPADPGAGDAESKVANSPRSARASGSTNGGGAGAAEQNLS